MVSGSSRRAVPSHTAPPTVTPGGQSRAATRGARLVRCPGTHSSGSSACTLARPPAAREASPALNLAAPDVCIPPRRARSALPTCRLRSAIHSPRSSVAATPTPQDSPGPGGTPGHLLPEPPFVLHPPPDRPPPPTHPGCTRPCRQRQPAAPSHEHCGAPLVCNAERRPRAARAGSAAEGGRERGWRGAPGGGGGARATPTRARPRGSRGQSARAGGAEPSAGLVHWPGAHRPTRGGSWGGDPAPQPSLQTRAEDRRSQVAEKGELGTCPGSGFPRRIHGYLFAQVAGSFLRATPSTASRVFHRGSAATRPHKHC